MKAQDFVDKKIELSDLAEAPGGFGFREDDIL